MIEEPPEMAAFNRWREQDFQAVERQFARAWRAAIDAIDLKAVAASMRNDDRVFSFSDLAAVKAAADRATSPRYNRYRQLNAVMTVYDVPNDLRARIVKRWRKAGRPPLSEFAPFTHYRLIIDLFFNLAIASGHISAERPTNRIDIAYLYYLPFCQLFVSGDRLHEKVAPLFLRADQRFVRAQDLKADLGKLVAHYDGMSEEAKSAGAMKYAAHPPADGDFLTSRLHDLFLPGWRTQAANPVQLTPEANDEIVKRILGLIDAAKDKTGDDEVRGPAQPEEDEMAMQYSVRRQVGRWKLF